MINAGAFAMSRNEYRTFPLDILPSWTIPHGHFPVRFRTSSTSRSTIQLFISHNSPTWHQWLILLSNRQSVKCASSVARMSRRRWFSGACSEQARGSFAAPHTTAAPLVHALRSRWTIRRETQQEASVEKSALLLRQRTPFSVAAVVAKIRCDNAASTVLLTQRRASSFRVFNESTDVWATDVWATNF